MLKNRDGPNDTLTVMDVIEGRILFPNSNDAIFLTLSF